jgi:hypothetical protein
VAPTFLRFQTHLSPLAVRNATLPFPHFPSTNMAFPPTVITRAPSKSPGDDADDVAVGAVVGVDAEVSVLDSLSETDDDWPRMR